MDEDEYQIFFGKDDGMCFINYCLDLMGEFGLGLYNFCKGLVDGDVCFGYFSGYLVILSYILIRFRLKFGFIFRKIFG